MSRRTRRNRAKNGGNGHRIETAVQTEPLTTLESRAADEPPLIEVEYAETEADAIAIHRFLCIVAAPVLLAPISATKSMDEIWRVICQDFALMATIDGELVGSLGVVMPGLWYAEHRHYMTDRWFFTNPLLKNRGVGAALLAEAATIGMQSGLDLVITGHLRRRARGVGKGLLFNRPMVVGAGEPMDFDEVEKRLLTPEPI